MSHYETWTNTSDYWFELRSNLDWGYPGFYNSSFVAGSALIPLWTAGCWSEGVQNCTATCLDPVLIWGSEFTFSFNVTSNVANCAAYNLFAAALDDPEFDFRGLDQKNVAAELGILSASQAGISTLALINETINTCMTEFCNDNETCLVNNQYRYVGGTVRELDLHSLVALKFDSSSC